jgi:hypothetical protein
MMVSFPPPQTKQDVLDIRQAFAAHWKENGVEYTEEELKEMFPLEMAESK